MNLKIEYISIEELKPYIKNARKHPVEQIKQIEESIKNFDMIDPIGIWKDNTIIEGHGRLIACKNLGFKEVPIIRLDHLSDEERKAYTLAHNKIAEGSEWDFELINEEMEDIFNFDMEDFGFEFMTEEEHQKNKDKPLEIQKKFNILEFDSNRCVGKYEMPVLEPVDFKPTRLVGFNYAKSSKDFDFGIHFYLDDYQFERLWNNFDNYVGLLRKFECVLTPHFSVYADMAKPIRVYNTFRGKLLGQMMQDRGLTVIPTVYWGETEDTYDYEFDGLPENSTLSIYTMNYYASEWANEVSRKGLIELLKRKKPKRLLIYTNGREIDDVDFGNTEVIYYKNEVTERMKNIK